MRYHRHFRPYVRFNARVPGTPFSFSIGHGVGPVIGVLFAIGMLLLAMVS
jgi:hypothetical protein